MKIYVAFNEPPDAYPDREKINPNTITCHFVYNALRKQFGDRVEFVHWSLRPDYRDDDIVVGLLPGASLHWKRRIVISNDAFEVDKWKHGRFRKYGLDLQTDHTFCYNHVLKDSLACVFMTNDVAIKKWNDDNPDVKEKKNWLLANVGSMRFTQHPIDKDFLCRKWNPDRRFDRLRILVHHQNWRKNATELIELLRKCGFKEGEDFDVSDWINKCDEAELDRTLSRYAYLGHVSVSENFPYLANEFLCQGMLLYGHEEWWDGYGYQGLRWTYDPTRQAHNVESLKVLIGTGYLEQYHRIRKEIWERHVGRSDNTWEHFTNIVVEEVAKHV